MTLEDLKRHLAEKVHNERNRCGWFQGDLAKKSGISEKTISLIEQGRANPSLETIGRIANALEVDMLEFFPEKRGIITIDLNALEALRNK